MQGEVLFSKPVKSKKSKKVLCTAPSEEMDTVDYNSSCETFQQQALEIQEPGADFDPSVKPQSGEEYLMHMIYERKRCPAVVVRKPSKLGLKETQYVEIDDCMRSEKELFCSTPSSLLSTKEWKKVQSEDFQKMRDKISSVRRVLDAHHYNNELEPPLVIDILGWRRFCQDNPPLLRTILRLNQRTLEQLLKMLCVWISNADEVSSGEEDLPTTSTQAAAACVPKPLDLSFSDEWLGSWLYAVLACLHLPLEPDVHSTLRDIVRNCIRLRSNLLPQETEKAVPYNLFICLIANDFGQLDLAEFV